MITPSKPTDRVEAVKNPESSENISKNGSHLKKVSVSSGDSGPDDPSKVRGDAIIEAADGEPYPPYTVFEQEVARMGKPTWLAKLFVHYPIHFCCLQLIGMLIVTAIVIINSVYTIPVNNGRDFFVWSHITVENFDLAMVANSQILQEQGVDTVPPRLIENNAFSLQIIYECKGCDNILTVENLKIVEQVEMDIFLSEEFRYFCLRESIQDPNCNSDFSMVSLPSIIKGMLDKYSL